MNTEQFRKLCEQILVPLLTKEWEHHFIDIHDILDITSNELMRMSDRLDDIDTHLCRDIAE